jgi:hypothetical protein
MKSIDGLSLKQAKNRSFIALIKPRFFLSGFLFFLLIHQNSLFAQSIKEKEEKATVKETKKEKPDYSFLPKNPRKATVLSALIPGAGQVYNGKLWKVPVLYAGFMTDIYFINYNNKRYETLRDALFAFDKGDRTQFPSLNRNSLVRNVDFWRQNRDLTILLLLAIYALNLVDANVDAHLSGFDISDNLALKIEPGLESLNSGATPYGLTFKLQFK